MAFIFFSFSESSMLIATAKAGFSLQPFSLPSVFNVNLAASRRMRSSLEFRQSTMVFYAISVIDLLASETSPSSPFLRTYLVRA